MLVAILAVAAVVYASLTYLTSPAGPLAKPISAGFAVPREGDEEKIIRGMMREEHEYLCGDVQIIFQGRVPEELAGYKLCVLESKYPPDDGWTVEITPKTIILRKRHFDFCPEHKHYRHLGISEGCLAIFEEPLGNNYKLLRVERKIPIEKLPVSWQIKLEQALKFDQQLPEIKDQLQKELEFNSERALNVALESLEEYVSI